MPYSNRKELKELVGRTGVFYNYGGEKYLIIGVLQSVSENGNCEMLDGGYFDEFEPKTRGELIEIINKMFINHEWKSF